MNTAIVIPVGPSRQENLRASLQTIKEMTVKPTLVVTVMDGEVDISDEEVREAVSVAPTEVLRVAKHEPGMEQPRNLGVRWISRMNEDLCTRGLDLLDHVWFLDSDILVAPDALAHYEETGGGRILAGPYDWLPSGVREPMPELRNDPRWPSFNDHDPQEALESDLSAGLACFSGNLVWPIDQFTRIGGFWNELHHGRCEDGELGLRAVACGIPISFVREARGWHLDHPINVELTLERNRRDVPMLNLRHPWVQGEGLFVVEQDGKRFNVRCACGWEGNTAEIWHHQAGCDLLPEGLK